MSDSFSVSGLDTIKAAFASIDKDKINAVVKKNMTEIYNRGKRPGGTPVRTGELRQSLIPHENADGSMDVGYTKEYAPYVEYGHRTPGGGWVPGQHYLRQNVNAQQAIFQRDIEALAKKGGK